MIEENIKSEVVGVDISIESTTYAIVDVRAFTALPTNPSNASSNRRQILFMTQSPTPTGILVWK